MLHMKQQTSNDINAIKGIVINNIEPSEIVWRRNHGKFIHEELYKDHQTKQLVANNAKFQELNHNLELNLNECKQALQDLANDLDSEIARATQRENEIEKEVQDEIFRAKTAENQLEITKVNVEDFNAYKNSNNQAVQEVKDSVTKLNTTLRAYINEQVQSAVSGLEAQINALKTSNVSEK